MYSLTYSRLSLSTSSPVPSGEAGWLVTPVSEQPKRNTTQWPAGGVQSRVPSGCSLEVRSTMSLFGMASRAATGGVENESKLRRLAKPAFSSKRLTRAPG